MVVTKSLSRTALFSQMAATKMFQLTGVRTGKQVRIRCTRDNLTVKMLNL